jgi:hypothetical protein
MTLKRDSCPIVWVNTPVLLEAIQRYEQGRLPRPLALWLQSLLEIEEAPSSGQLRRTG